MNFPSHWVHHLLPLLEALYNVSIKQQSFSWKLLSFCCSSHTKAVPHPPCLVGQDFFSLFLHNFRSPLYKFVSVPAVDFDIYSSFPFLLFTSLIYFWKAITSLYSLHFVRLREIDFSNLSPPAFFSPDPLCSFFASVSLWIFPFLNMADQSSAQQSRWLCYVCIRMPILPSPS